jgi:hypothetical protein
MIGGRRPIEERLFGTDVSAVTHDAALRRAGTKYRHSDRDGALVFCCAAKAATPGFGFALHNVGGLMSDIQEGAGRCFRACGPELGAGCAAIDRPAIVGFSHPAIGTILVEIAAPHEFENAFFEKGPLPSTALDRLSTLLQTFSGEPG